MSIMTKTLVELLLDAYTLEMPLLCISILKDKLQLKLQVLALNLWQPELVLIKSFTSGTLSCILELQKDQKSYMSGDNKSEVDNASIPTSTLSNILTLASHHRVREAITAEYLQFNWKDRKSNPADILSKHGKFANIWSLLKPLLFWKRDTHEHTAKKKGSDRILA